MKHSATNDLTRWHQLRRDCKNHPDALLNMIVCILALGLLIGFVVRLLP